MIVTKAQSLNLINKIDNALKQNFKNKSVNNIFENIFNEDEKEFIKHVNEIKSMNKVTPDKFTDICKNTINSLFNAEVVTIAVSFEPTLDYLQNLHKSLVNNINKPFLIDVLTDPNLAQNATINYNGKVFSENLF
jgi:F0F1-type ATP synthase delta subunit